MYENGKIRPVETILRIVEGDKGERWRGVSLIKMYYKHYCKCHNAKNMLRNNPYNNMLIKKSRLPEI
jgi:hypothetical protein